MLGSANAAQPAISGDRSSSSTSSRKTIRSAAGEAAATLAQEAGLGAVAGDHQPQVVARPARGEAGDQVVDPLGVGEPGQEQHVPAGRQPAPGEPRLHLGRVRVEELGGVDRRVGDGHPLGALGGEVGAVPGVDGLGRLDDQPPGVVRHRHRDVGAQVRRQHVRGGAEPVLLDAGADHVGHVGADRLGDGHHVHRQPGRLRRPDRVGDGDGVRAQVERHGQRRHAVGEQLDQSAGQPGQVAPVRHLVVADRLRSLDDDARRCTARCRPAA